jgi:hypothetical protein
MYQEKPKRSGYASRPEDVPKVDHYALLTGDSVFIPGDERSRTNPGHGYGERTENYLNYHWFLDREEWEKEITERATSRYVSPAVAIFVSPAKVQTTVSVAVKIGD